MGLSKIYDKKLQPRIVVTGATGYIGERLVGLALSEGFYVNSLSRRYVPDPRVSWFHFELANPVIETWPESVDAVIHLAAQTGTSTALTAEEEIRAAECLLEAARNCGAVFIFVSSQTARYDAPSLYGRTKAAIEDRVISGGGRVVRPGLVYGGVPRGLFGTLQLAALQLPVMPYFIPSPFVQPIHVDDLAEGLLRVATNADIEPRIYCLGAAEPISFTRFLMAILSYRIQKKRVFLPVPQFVIRCFAYVLGASASQRLGIAQLLSLFDLPSMETGSDLRFLNLNLRSLREGMAKSARGLRKRQLLEAKTLLWYVLRQPPHSSLLRRYVRALEFMNKSTVLRLPRCVKRFPSLLAIVDGPGLRRSTQGAEFNLRLDAATLIAEASPQGAVRFLGGSRGETKPWVVFTLAKAVLAEIGFRLVGQLWKRICSQPMAEENR